MKYAGDYRGGYAVVDGSWILDKHGKRLYKLGSYSYVGSFDENGSAR